MAKRIGVLLSGCGAFDGSDVHEAVLTLLALDRAGVESVCAAPDMHQYDSMNHLDQAEMNESRNVLVESSRIAHGNIVELGSLKVHDIDGLIMPGGFGAVKNLSTFAIKGPECDINQHTHQLLQQMHAAAKPIGAISISALTVVMALKRHQPHVCVGSDQAIASAVTALGGIHHRCDVNEMHIDTTNKLVTTSSGGQDTCIKDLAICIEKLVEKIIAFIES